MCIVLSRSSVGPFPSEVMFCRRWGLTHQRSRSIAQAQAFTIVEQRLRRNLAHFVMSVAVHFFAESGQQRLPQLPSLRKSLRRRNEKPPSETIVLTCVFLRRFFVPTDVKNVHCVINFDFPNNVEDYVHRIGRTGRAGAKGTAITLFTSNNSKSARELVQLMRDAGQEITPKLEEFARYSKPGGGPSRYGRGGGFRRNGGGGGGRRW